MTQFSVIVPVYNGEKTVRRCVESILSCGGDNVEILLIEDCSKDNSRAVCRELAARYANVRCLENEQNHGVSYTRNRGLAAATGEYLLFVDCDDWVDPDYLSAFREVAALGGVFAVCGYVNHDEKNNGTADIYAWAEAQTLRQVPLQPCLKPLYDGNLLQQLWNKLFVAEYVHQHNLRFDESISIGEDTRFVLAYLDKVRPEQVFLINRPLYHYMRDQAGSLMFRVGYESIEEPLKNKEALYRLMGLSETEILQKRQEDRDAQLALYAYLIMHNAGMPGKEKKRLILALDPGQGQILYRRNWKLYHKEKLARFLRKRGVS